jgi:hypothetical protein
MEMLYLLGHILGLLQEPFLRTLTTQLRSVQTVTIQALRTPEARVSLSVQGQGSLWDDKVDQAILSAILGFPLHTPSFHPAWLRLHFAIIYVRPRRW